MKMYKIVSKGLNQQKLVPVSYDIEELIKQDPDHDYYEGFYFWGDEHKKKYDEVKSMKGFTGAYTKKLVFDFDSEDNIEKAKNDTVELVSRLIQNGMNESDLQIFYSGHKGFHVESNTTETFTRQEFASTVKALAEGLETFDPKIVNETRIFRVPLTKNVVTKRYKIPLTMNQLCEMSVQEIQDKAEKAESHWEELCGLLNYKEVELPPKIKAFKGKKKETKLEVVDENYKDRPNLANKPKHMSAARYTLQEGFFEHGERNEAYMILAATYKALGYSKEIAWRMLKGTDELQSKRTGQEEKGADYLWTNITEVVYSPTWRGATYSEKDNALLLKTIQKYNLPSANAESNLIALEDMSSMFKDFAENIDSNTIKLGLPSVDENLRITTSMLVCLLAAPSAGKSTVSFGVLNHLSKQNLKSFFFSLDMGAPLVYQRLIQRHTGDHSNTIFNNYKTKNKKTKEYEQILREEYKNVKFCFQSGLTVDNIRDTLLKEKEINGEVPKLVLVDYLECVDSQFSDSTQSKGYVAKRLKDIANEFNICVLLLVQPAKASGDPSQELTSYTQIKGSSVIQEAASVILTLSRPGFDTKNPENDRYVTFTVVKNRMGGLGSFDLGWDGLTGHIRELLVDEHEELKSLRNRIAQASKEDEPF
jgi:replicative DNA helicase